MVTGQLMRVWVSFARRNVERVKENVGTVSRGRCTLVAVGKGIESDQILDTHVETQTLSII